MNTEYYSIHQRAVGIQGMFQNMLDEPKHSLAQKLRDEIRDLILDIRANKHPKSIDGRVAAIQRHLLQSRNKGSEVMRLDENVHLLNTCEQFRRDLRKFPNYQ